MQGLGPLLLGRIPKERNESESSFVSRFSILIELRCQPARFMHFSFHLLRVYSHGTKTQLRPHETMPRSRGVEEPSRKLSSHPRQAASGAGAIEIIMRIWGRQHWDTRLIGGLLTRFFKLPLALDRAAAAGGGGNRDQEAHK